MKTESENKAERILSIYTRLMDGKVIYKMEESNAYGVAPRTIQRDIADIQCFLQNHRKETGEIQEIFFDKRMGGYRLETKLSNQLGKKDVLAVCKVLLESRSLIEEEMSPIINKLVSLCSSAKEQKLVNDLIANELHHYIELHHGKPLLDRIWKLEEAVKAQKYINIRYKKMKKETLVERKVKPVGVLFSEFYFYLTAYIEDIDREKEFQNPDDLFPTIYRVDRLEEIEVMDEHFSNTYSERFEEGEFRKRIQFMYGGRLRKVKFKYKGNSIEAVLDRLPTAEIISKEEDGVLVQAEVFGDGINGWIRGMGNLIEEV